MWKSLTNLILLIYYVGNVYKDNVYDKNEYDHLCKIYTKDQNGKMNSAFLKKKFLANFSLRTSN